MSDIVSEQAAGPTNLYMDPKLPGFLRSFGVDLFFDVGANAGQFVRELLAAGYEGRIVSFEPVSAAYAKLIESSQDSNLWVAERRCALGAADGSATINVAGNLQSSSMLGMLDRHVRSAPASRYVGTETVDVRTLDGLGAKYTATAQATFLKIDVQGFEDQVLRGAARLLPQIAGIQIEMPLVPLYEGERDIEWWLQRMRALGFELWWIRPGFTDRDSGRALQMDGIFFRPIAGGDM
ncbi:MAG: FkbM family methyltransferase [bacterium]|nr:FkbM family methyltransferase [bacterium]MCP4968127.1 FkbM family methyltransferase [bacterium]